MSVTIYFYRNLRRTNYQYNLFENFKIINRHSDSKRRLIVYNSPITKTSRQPKVNQIKKLILSHRDVCCTFNTLNTVWAWLIQFSKQRIISGWQLIYDNINILDYQTYSQSNYFLYISSNKHTFANVCSPVTTTRSDCMDSSSCSHPDTSTSGLGSICDSFSKCGRSPCKLCGSLVRCKAIINSWILEAKDAGVCS